MWTFHSKYWTLKCWLFCTLQAGTLLDYTLIPKRNTRSRSSWAVKQGIERNVSESMLSEGELQLSTSSPATRSTQRQWLRSFHAQYLNPLMQHLTYYLQVSFEKEDLNNWVKCSILYPNLMNKTWIHIHQAHRFIPRSRNTWEHVWWDTNVFVSCSEGIYQNVAV